jgi:hypothetical protein
MVSGVAAAAGSIAPPRPRMPRRSDEFPRETGRSVMARGLLRLSLSGRARLSGATGAFRVGERTS